MELGLQQRAPEAISNYLLGHGRLAAFNAPVSKVLELMVPALHAFYAGKELRFSKSIDQIAASVD